MSQDCPNDKKCFVGQTYGWTMNTWCVGNVADMSYLFADMSTFNEDISSWDVSNVVNMQYMFDRAASFNQDISGWNTSSVTNMKYMFWGATSFNGDLSAWNTKSVNDMGLMFYGAKSFNQDLCAWGDVFPYDLAYDIFANSGCTNTSTPQEDQKGPFCASDCAVSIFACYVYFCNNRCFFCLCPNNCHSHAFVHNCEIMLPEQKPTTLEPTPVPETFSECTDTPNYLDMWGGGCGDYELPGNEAWCRAYGNMGEEGNTPNKNCCACKALVETAVLLIEDTSAP